MSNVGVGMVALVVRRWGMMRVVRDVGDLGHVLGTERRRIGLEEGVVVVLDEGNVEGRRGVASLC